MTEADCRDDGAVEALAKHLYLTTDTLWDHRVVTWDRLDAHNGHGRAHYRELARRYLQVAVQGRGLVSGLSGPWTRHGHAIPGVTIDGPGQPPIARCGGPALCQECATDAARLHTAPDSTPTEREAGDVGEVAAKVITISPVEWGDLIRNAQANAWDEGWQEAWSPMSMHNRDDGPNPYRQTREDAL